MNETKGDPHSRLGSGALGNIPDGLRDELLFAFSEIILNFRAGRWEPSELNGGKLCEVAYSILRGYADGAFPTKAKKPRNMLDACRALESTACQLPRSLRIQLPRMLIALYEIRNNRGVGHVGGDVDPNHMDAAAVVAIAKWVIAELIRVFHGIDTRAASELTDSLVERDIPIVWDLGETKRVLSPDMKMMDKALLLLHRQPGTVAERELVSWVEHSNPSVFRRDILGPAHKLKLIEYDREAATVRLSPLGAQYVEKHLPLTVQSPPLRQKPRRASQRKTGPKGRRSQRSR